jgi:WD40 repeat protein
MARFAPTSSFAVLLAVVLSCAARGQSPEKPVEVATLEKHTGVPTQVAFAPAYPRSSTPPALSQGGPHLISTSADGQVILWDVSKRQSLQTLAQISEHIGAAAFHPRSPVFAFGNHFPYGSVVRAIDLQTGKVSVVGGTRCPNFVNIHAVDYSPDGKLLALCSSEKSIKVHSTQFPGKAKAAVPASHVGRAVAFTNPAKAAKKPATAGEETYAMAFGCEDGTVQTAAVTLQTQAKGRPLPVPEVRVKAKAVEYAKHGKPVTCVRYSPDNEVLASASLDGTVVLSNAESGAIAARLQVGSPVNCVAFDPLGAYLATASDDGTVQIWDAKSGGSLATLKAHSKGATWVDVSPDGLYVASGGRDFAVRVWQVRPLPKK